jgi:hypothetical protein
MISRRAFIGSLIGGIAATAAARTWPFRVYSFPTQVVTFDQVTQVTLEHAKAWLARDTAFNAALLRNLKTSRTLQASSRFDVGDMFRV